MSTPLLLRRLQIKHAPGFPNDRLAPMTFGEGVNIIVGPNASGKTTTARAIQALLWPQTGSADTFISAEIAVNGQSGHFLYSGGSRQDDPALPFPKITDATSCHRYMLAQHELLAVDETGKNFADEIMREARGGVDLGRAMTTLGYQDTTRARGTTDITEARQAYEQAKAAEREIAGDERRLEEWHTQLRAAEAAQAALPWLLLAREYHRQTELCEQLTAALERYPAELTALTGHELEELDALRTLLADEVQAGDAATREIADAQQRLARAQLADPAAVDVVAAAVAPLCEEIARAEQACEARRAEVTRAVEETRHAFTNLGGQTTDGFANPLDAGVVAALEAFAKRAESLAGRLQLLEEHLRWLASITPAEQTPSGPLHEATHLLRLWLATDMKSPRTASPFPVAGMAAGALATLFGALAARQAPLAWLAALGGVATIIFFALLVDQQRPTGLTRRELEERFVRLHLEQPATWDSVAVEHLAQALDARAAAAELADKTAEKSRELTLTRQELAPLQVELAAEGERLAAQLGVSPERAFAPGHSSLLYLVTQLADWQRKGASLQAAQADLARIDEELAAALAQVNARLAPFGYAPAEHSGEARNLLHHLTARQRDAITADVERQGAERRGQESARKRLELLERRTALLARLGLDPDPEIARGRLLVLLETRAEYLSAAKAQQDAVAVRAETVRKGRQCPEWDILLLRETPALQQALEEAQTAVEGMGALHALIGKHDQKVAAAKEQHACEQARVALERAQERGYRRRNAALHAGIGWYLAETLEAQALDTVLPQVFQRARTLFATFTNNRYELRLSRGQETTFQAYDAVDGAERGLNHLSSATRVQLLMAVRVAFVEERETEIKLPLLMDETLACSDAARERAIVDAALLLCREGRQICYFTSKPSELAVWQAQAASAGVTVTVIDLGQTPAERVIAPASPAEFPMPDALHHAAYGQLLGVPRLDFLTGSAAAAHCWYVVEDPIALHEALTHGITTCGQLCQPYLQAIIDILLGPHARSARALSVVLADLEALWREGRGVPLDFAALQRMGVLTTDGYKKELPALAEEVRWEAKPFIAALEAKRIKGFRAEALQKVRDYCEDHGHLVEGDPLTPAEIHDRLLARATAALQQGQLTADEVQRLCARVLVGDMG